MSCNKKCITNGVRCTNLDCSQSNHKNTYEMHELVSKVVITPNCSSVMLQCINSWSLKPSSFKINKWEVV